MRVRSPAVRFRANGPAAGAEQPLASPRPPAAPPAPQQPAGDHGDGQRVSGRAHGLPARTGRAPTSCGRSPQILGSACPPAGGLPGTCGRLGRRGLSTHPGQQRGPSRRGGCRGGDRCPPTPFAPARPLRPSPVASANALPACAFPEASQGLWPGSHTWSVLQPGSFRTRRLPPIPFSFLSSGNEPDGS